MITLLVLITIITQLFLLFSTGLSSATSLNEDAPPDYIVTTCSPPIDNINLPGHRLVIESLADDAAELSLTNPCPHLKIINSNFKAIYIPSHARTVNKSHTAAVFHNFTLRNVSSGHVSIRTNELRFGQKRIVQINNRLPTFEVSNVRVNFNMGKNYSQQPEDYSTAFQFLNRKIEEEGGVEFESFTIRDSSFIANTEFSFHSAATVRPDYYDRENRTLITKAMVHLDGIRFADTLSFVNNTLFSTYLALSIDDVIFSNEDRSSAVIENNSVTMNDEICSSRERCTAISGVRVIFAVNLFNRNLDDSYIGPAPGSSGKTPDQSKTYHPPQLSIINNRFVSTAKFAYSSDNGGVRIRDINFLPSSSPFSAVRHVFINNNTILIDHSQANLQLNPVYDSYNVINENASYECIGLYFIEMNCGSAPLEINNNIITVWKMLILYGILFHRETEFSAAVSSQLEINNNIFDISSNIPALLVSRAPSNSNGYQSNGMAAIRFNLELKLPSILRIEHNTAVNLTQRRPIFKLDFDPRAPKLDTQIGTPVTFLELSSMEGIKHMHVNDNRVSNFGLVADSRYINALTFIESRVKYLKLFTVIETFNCSNNIVTVAAASKAQYFFFINTEFDLTSVVRPKNLILENNIADARALAIQNCGSCATFATLLPDMAGLFETQICAFALLLGTVLFEKMYVVNNSFTGTASLAVNPRTGGKSEDESGQLRILFFGSLIQMAQPFPSVSLGNNIKVAVEMTNNNFHIFANPLADPLSTKASAFQQSPGVFPLFIFGPYTYPFDRSKTATIDADFKVQDNNVTSEAGASTLCAISGTRFSASGKSSFRMARNRLVATVSDFQKTLDEGSLEAIELSLKPFPMHYQDMQYSSSDGFIHLTWKYAEIVSSKHIGLILFESVGFGHDDDDDDTNPPSNNNNIHNNYYNNFFLELTGNIVRYSNAVFSFLVMLHISFSDVFPMKIDGNQLHASKFSIPSRFSSSTAAIVQSGKEELFTFQLSNLRGRSGEQQQRPQPPRILIQNQVATLSAISGAKLIKTNTSEHVFLKIMEYSDSGEDETSTSSNNNHNRNHNTMLLNIEMRNNTISESNHRSSSLISIGGDLGRALNSINSISATANTMAKTFDIDEASFEAVSLVAILPSSSFTSLSSTPTSPRISLDSNIFSIREDRTNSNNKNNLLRRIKDQREDTQKWFGFKIPSEVLNSNNNNLGSDTSMIIFNLTSTTSTCNQLRLLTNSSSNSSITLDTNILLENPLVDSAIAGALCETPLPPSSQTQTETNGNDQDEDDDDFVPPPQPVADALRASEVTESVSMATMAIGAAAVPSLAFTVSRQDSMTSFAKHALDGDCRGLLPRLEKPEDYENFDDAVPLPPSTSPTQMAIGSSRARYLIGAVVGNFILMVGLLLLNIFLGKTLFLFIRARVAAYKLKTLRSNSSSRKDHKTPSSSASSPWYDDAIIQAYVTLTFFFCLSLLLSPTLTSTVILLAGGISNEEVSIGTKIGCLIISLIMASLGVYFALWSTILRKPDREKFRINEQHQKEMLKNSTSPLSVFKYLFGSEGEWKLPSNNNVTKKQSDQFSLALPAFESNRNAKWFALVEISTAICLSLPPLFAQLPNDGKTSCIVYGSMLFLIFVVYTVLLVWKRPFKLRIMRIMLPLMAIQQTVTVVMVFVNAMLIANRNTNNNNNNRNKNGDENSSWLWRVILVPLGFEAFLGVLSIGAAFFPLFMFLKKIFKRVNREVASSSASNNNKKSKKDNLTSLMRDQDEGELQEEMLSRGGSFAHHHHHHHHRDRREDKEKNDSGRRSRNQSFHRTSSSNRNGSFSPSSSSRPMMRNENEENRRRDRSADKGRDRDHHHHHHHHHRSWQEQQTSTRKEDDNNNRTTSGHRHRYKNDNNDDENDNRTLLRSPHRRHNHSSRNTTSRSDRPTTSPRDHHHHHHSSSSRSGRNNSGTRERTSPSDKSKISPENRAFNNFSFSRSPDLPKMLTPKLSATSPSLPTSVNNNDSKHHHHYHRRKKENSNDDNERLEFSRRGGKSSQYHDDRRK